MISTKVSSHVTGTIVVGFADVLQQTPLAVMVAPPSDVTSPPLEALVIVTEDAAVVVTVGTSRDVTLVKGYGSPSL
jgi:hypothetical protein